MQTAWDGENYTEPQKNESGAYLIGSPDELMWFDKHAQMTDSAVLTADITINEDVNAEATGLYKWTPIDGIKITVHLLNIRVHLTVMDIPFPVSMFL